jgi:hypothetical protein
MCAGGAACSRGRLRRGRCASSLGRVSQGKCGGKRDEPIKFGMKRKMFSLGRSLAALAGCAAAPLPFARLRTADIAKEKVACYESCLGAVSQPHSKLVRLQVPRCRGVV